MNEWERNLLGLPQPDEINSIVMLFIILAVVIVILLWILLPFAVFGIKARLERANEINNQILGALDQITRTLQRPHNPANDNPVRDDIRLCPKCHQDNPAGIDACQHCGQNFAA